MTRGVGATTRTPEASQNSSILDDYASPVTGPIRQAVWSALQTTLRTQTPHAHERHAFCSSVNPRAVIWI